MDISTAAGLLGSTLEVTEARYPTNVRIMHLNAAQLTLAREYETKVTEFNGYIELTSGTENFLLTDVELLEPDQVVPSFVRAMFYTTEYTWSQAVGYTPTGDWVRLQPYSDYTALVTAHPEQDQATPVGYAEHGISVHVRPITDVPVLLFVFLDALPGYAETGDTRLLRDDPFSVIYSAAITACVWMGDEERMPVYERLYTRHIEAMNIADSERNDGPRETTEV